MRHRITSFRCVEAKRKMSLIGPQRKTCNAVNIRQSSCLRVFQARQSSITRAASAHGGTTSGGSTPTVKPTRPRLLVMASSSGSNAASSIVSLPVAELNADGTLRVIELVQTLMNGAAALARLAMATRRLARVHCTHNCGLPDASEKLAWLPPLVAA